ncbi:hypothetical protein JT359_19875 [Candidatus Poribacteria bacterium]|nr:hypothetical protein [Candidatus Poribacteria bacterium]
MKHYSRFITLAGGILAFFSLALPWESNYSGLRLAIRDGGIVTLVFIVSIYIIGISIYLISTRSHFNPLFITIALIIGLIGTYGSIVVFSRSSHVNLNCVTIAFIASWVIIGTSIYMLNRQSHWKSLPTLCVTISSIVGICCFLVLMFGETLNIVLNDVHVEDLKYGASLTAVGFILAIAGVLCFPNTKNDSETHREEESEEISVGEEE